MVLGFLVRGVLLGLGAAAPIGPVNVEIARRTLRFGRAAGFFLGCGAVTVDVIYAVVTSLTLLPVRDYPTVMKGLGLAGGAFLGWLGILCLRGAMRGHGREGAGGAVVTAPPSSRAKHYLHGLLMTALNPMTLLFWFVGVPGTVGGGGGNLALPLVCAGVFAGALSWVSFFTLLIGHAGRFGTQRWLGVVDVAGGLMLLGFAAMAIWRVVSGSL